MTSTANDHQVGGDHYQTGGLQHWDLFGAEYLMAAATKYMRWRKKGGVEDLEKALHYAEKLREGVSGGLWRECPVLNVERDTVNAWMRNYGLDWVEQTICINLLYWKQSADIDEAIAGIQYLIETERGKPAKDKPYNEMTDTELSDELARLNEEQGKAKSWGAAVGVRAEYIKEVITIQSRRERRVPRYDGPTLKGPMQEAMRAHASMMPGQRTPEDGAQHAGVAPWVVTDDWLGASEIGTDLISAFWKRRAPGVYVLEPNVDTANIPRVLRSCYNLKVGVGWVIDIRKCPPDVRDRFPNLIREQNMKEWEDLPEWERGLYEWNEQGNKYTLGQFTEAWHVEAD